MQNTFYWEAARYISVAIIPGAGARYFTYANESDARRHETSMREWHGSQGSFTYYTIRDAGNILRAAEHWTMCRDCKRCRPSRPHLRQQGKQHECDLLGTDGHGTWTRRRTAAPGEPEGRKNTNRKPTAMINILLSIKKLFSVSKKKFPQTKKNEKEFVFKPCCRNCINNEGDFFCYTYGLFNTPESLNDYCQDWELADDCEE